MSFTIKSMRTSLPIVVECDHTREIKPGELIHYKSANDLHACIVCGLHAVTAWTDDQELWQRSPVRCL